MVIGAVIGGLVWKLAIPNDQSHLSDTLLCRIGRNNLPVPNSYYCSKSIAPSTAIRLKESMTMSTDELERILTVLSRDLPADLDTVTLIHNEEEKFLKEFHTENRMHSIVVGRFEFFSKDRH